MSAPKLLKSNRVATKAELWLAISKLVREFKELFKQTTFPELRALRVLKGFGNSGYAPLLGDIGLEVAIAAKMIGLDILKTQGIFGWTSVAELLDRKATKMKLWGLTRRGKWVLIECDISTETYGSNPHEWTQDLLSVISKPSTLDEVLDLVNVHGIIQAFHDQAERLQQLAEKKVDKIKDLRAVCSAAIKHLPDKPIPIWEITIKRAEADIDYLSLHAVKVDQPSPKSKLLKVQIAVPSGHFYCHRCGRVELLSECEKCIIKIFKPNTED